MSKKPIIEIIKDEKVPIIIKSNLDKANDFKQLLGAYQLQNPVKYEQKKEALEKKLGLLTGENK